MTMKHYAVPLLLALGLGGTALADTAPATKPTTTAMAPAQNMNEKAMVKKTDKVEKTETKDSKDKKGTSSTSAPAPAAPKP